MEVLDNYHSSEIVALKIELTPSRIGEIIMQPKIEPEVIEIFSQKQKEANYLIKNQHLEEALQGEETQVVVGLIHQEYILVEVLTQVEVHNLVFAEIVELDRLVDSMPYLQPILHKNQWDMALVGQCVSQEITWAEDLITLHIN